MADDSKNDDVGQRYAQALFELAQDADQLTAVETDLKGLKGLYRESADLRRLFGTGRAVVPTVSRDVLAAGPDPAALRSAAARWAEELAR